jgi:dienelactone hydrolase
MPRFVVELLLFLIFSGASVAQESYARLVHRFDYDRSAPLDLREAGVSDRDGVKVHDISYASLNGGRVPAYLIVPPGKGPLAAILFGHWAMDGSPMRNRTEFLEEAVALAHAGAVSLLIDAPFARPGVTEDKDVLSPQQADLFLQEVLDLRRGVDLLIARKDVDPKRIAYVGHSYNAGVGGVLAGVEKRIKAFVLMAGGLSDAEIIGSDEPQIVNWRQSVGEKRIEEYVATYGWLDPGHYIGHAAPSAVLLQYARNDGMLTEARERRYFDLVSKPKTLQLYDATHALNAQARRDRYQWLRTRIGLRRLDPAILDSVKEIK